MRKHPGYTRDILSRVGCFASLVDVAASHHERLDGSGYHRRLNRDQLPMAARVLCVADICDALRASRPYREGLPPSGSSTSWPRGRHRARCRLRGRDAPRAARRRGTAPMPRRPP